VSVPNDSLPKIKGETVINHLLDYPTLEASVDTQDIKNAKNDMQRRASAARDVVEDKIDEIDPDGWFKRNVPNLKVRALIVGLAIFGLGALVNSCIG